MLALIYKDLYQARKAIIRVSAIWFFLSIIAILSSIRGENNHIGSLLVYFYSFMAAYIIVQQVLYNEDKYKGIYFMKTLPVKTSMIVDNKFATVMVLNVLDFAVSIILLIAVGAIEPRGLSFADNFINMLMIISLSLLYCGILLLLFFYVGPSKSSQYMSYVTVFIIIIFSMGPSLIQGTAAEEFIKNALDLLNKPYVPFVVFVVSLLIYDAFWLISLRVFKHKSYM